MWYMRGVRNMLFQRTLMETLLSTGCVSADSMILHKRKSTHLRRVDFTQVKMLDSRKAFLVQLPCMAILLNLLKTLQRHKA